MYRIYISHKHTTYTTHPRTPSPFAPSFTYRKSVEIPWEPGACGDMDAAVELQLKAVRSSTSPAVAKVSGRVLRGSLEQ